MPVPPRSTRRTNSTDTEHSLPPATQDQTSSSVIPRFRDIASLSVGILTAFKFARRMKRRIAQRNVPEFMEMLEQPQSAPGPSPVVEHNEQNGIQQVEFVAEPSEQREYHGAEKKDCERSSVAQQITPVVQSQEGRGDCEAEMNHGQRYVTQPATNPWGQLGGHEGEEPVAAPRAGNKRSDREVVPTGQPEAQPVTRPVAPPPVININIVASAFVNVTVHPATTDMSRYTRNINSGNTRAVTIARSGNNSSPFPY